MQKKKIVKKKPKHTLSHILKNTNVSAAAVEREYKNRKRWGALTYLKKGRLLLRDNSLVLMIF